MVPNLHAEGQIAIENSKIRYRTLVTNPLLLFVAFVNSQFIIERPVVLRVTSSKTFSSNVCIFCASLNDFICHSSYGQRLSRTSWFSQLSEQV